MMDLQKEREEFEAWHYEQYLIENPNIDITNAKYIYDYAHKNALVCQLKESHFIVWQAAKAQAVPEGFKVVSFKQVSELVVAVNKVDLMTHTEQKTNEARLAWQDIASKLQTMIEAQEQVE